MKKIFVLFVLSIFILPACNTSKKPLDKRIKQQKRRQKHNPMDCPRIDCQIELIEVVG